MKVLYTYQGKQSVLDNEKTEIIVGRPKKGARIDLDLTPDSTVSRPHARIWFQQGQYWIEDLNSAGGTLVEGQEIKGKTKHKLQAGTDITIGETLLQVGVAVPREDDPELTSILDTSATVVSGEPVVENEADLLASKIPAADLAQRLVLFYEMASELKTQMRLDHLLQKTLEHIVRVIPSAKSGSIIVEDPTNRQLLLKAHFPPGRPAMSLTLARRAMEQHKSIIWQKGEETKSDDAEMELSILMSHQEHQMGCVMYAPLLCDGESLGAMCVGNDQTCSVFRPEDLRLIEAVAHHAATAVSRDQLHETVRRNAVLLGRVLTNFSPKIRDKLLAKTRHGRLRLGGEKSEVTILCSDIRGFTRLTAGMEAEDVVDLLNEYFSRLVDSIFKFDGTVDKFVGDSILAVFGSPEPDSKQHENAVRAALAMQDAMRELNAARKARRQVTCEIGIGIESGEVLHGFIGSDERMEFTVIGDAVNRATRYCDGCPAGAVLISTEVHQRAWKIVQAQPTTIKTKHEGDFSAFRVTGFRDPQSRASERGSNSSS